MDNSAILQLKDRARDFCRRNNDNIQKIIKDEGYEFLSKTSVKFDTAQLNEGIVSAVARPDLYCEAKNDTKSHIVFFYREPNGRPQLCIYTHLDGRGTIAIINDNDAVNKLSLIHI